MNDSWQTLVYRVPVVVVACLILFSAFTQGHSSTNPSEDDIHGAYDQLVEKDSVRNGLEMVRQYAQGLIAHDVDSAIAIYHWLQQEAEKHRSDSFQFYSYEALSTLYRMSGRHDLGLMYSRKAYQFVGEDDLENRAWKLNYWGYAYLKLGQFDSAQYYLKQCHLLKAEHPEVNLISPANHLGLLYGQTGDFDFATIYFFEALEEILESSQELGKGVVLFNLASLFMRMKNTVKAREYFDMTRSFARNNSYRGLETKADLGFARIFLEENKLDSAEYLLNNAFDFLSESDNALDLINCMQLQSELNIKRGDLQSAGSFLRKASEMVKFINDEEKQVSQLIALAHLNSSAGNEDRSLDLMQKALSRATEYELTIQKEEIYRWLAGYFANRDANLAAQYYRLHLNVRDTIDMQKRARVAYEMETRQIEAEKRSEIRQLTRDREEEAKKALLRRKLNYTLLALLIVCAGMLGFTWLSMRKNKVIARQEKELFEQQLVLKEQESDIARMHALVDGQEIERKRIATELHDGLGSLLAGTAMQLQAFGRDHDEKKIAGIRIRLDEAYEEVRRISHRMMPGHLVKRGLVHALRELCIDLKRTGGMGVDFQVIGDPVSLGEDREIALYRIAQELLNNVARHSEATEVITQISYLDGEIALSVADNGTGFDKDRLSDKPSMGFQSITSRVVFLRGNLDIDSSPGRGTEVMVTLPL